MTNQQIRKENPNNLTAEFPPAKRVYAFRDLPKNIQENLLRLQNSDGDFLRLSNSVTASRIILLILLAFGFALFLASFEDSVFNWQRISILIIGALIFALWVLYLILGIFRTMRSPIKNQIYLTPTQVIETKDGTVRFRQLKDAAEISVNRYWSDVGRRSSLDIKFADGDLYQYKLGTNNNSLQLAETTKWREKTELWRSEALSASRRGDAADDAGR